MLASLERKPLGQLLLQRQLIKAEHLERALEEQKQSNHQKLLGEILVDMRHCTEEQVCEALALAYDIPYAHVTPRLCDPKAIRALPKEFLEKHQVLPLFLVEGTLTIAVPEPANVFLLEEIERLSGFAVQVVAATVQDIRTTARTLLPQENTFVIDDLIDEVTPECFSLVEQRVENLPHPERAASDSPVIKLVNYCIYDAVKSGASDIHIEPADKLLRVRHRIDGRLTEKLRPPYAMAAAVAARIKSMGGLDATERKLPQEGAFQVLVDKRPIDLRVSTMPGTHGETVVLRIVDDEKASANLEKLGFGYDTLKQWRKLIARPNGILLVTGPTGSGKGATLYASLHELNRDDVNICTVEDPVQGKLSGVNQFQVDEKVGFGFPAALRSLLRQDPDVIMLGELREPEAAKMAIHAALTGHLVLAALHTNDAASAITRLFNLGIEPYLVGAALGGVLSQRWVRKLCQSCREPYAPTINERRQMEKAVGGIDTLYRPKGCARCRSLGYCGRIGIYELLAMDDALVDTISQGGSLAEIRRLVRSHGSKSLRTDGIEKVKAGITTLEEVYRATT